MAECISLVNKIANAATIAEGYDIQTDTSQHLGTHEVQECLEGQCEADLHTHLANCKKNPGHAGFIPVKKFRKEHLPPGYQDSDIYDVIKAQSYLTVRIAVEFTSPDRPEFVLGTKDPYPCYETRGQRKLRTGTGSVWKVSISDRESKAYIPCPCPECKKSTKPKKKWFNGWIQTARHVIYDSKEAKQSSCRLWFDYDQSPMVKIYGWRAGGISHTGQDWCTLICATHDEDIAEKLLNVFRSRIEVWGKVNAKYENRRDLDKLAIVISHPHGCSKQISVGHWVHREPVGLYNRYTYTTCTCPGSSGAPVYKLGWTVHPHCGADASGSNYSTAMCDMDFSITEEEKKLKWLVEMGPSLADEILASTDDRLQFMIR